jgi:hypothetical protein
MRILIAAALAFACTVSKRSDGSPVMPMLGLAPAQVADGVKVIFAVSPDERSVLVSHESLGPCDCGGMCSAPVELSLLTGGASTSLGATAHWARFSPDGNFILFGMSCRPGLGLARADGTGARPLPPRATWSFAGPWLYYSELAGTTLSLYRLRRPDGMPELVVSFPAPQGPGGFHDEPAPDGEAVTYCDPANDCHLQSFSGGAPVKIPPGTNQWSPGGGWFLSSPCTIIDRAGNKVWSCDAASLLQPPAIFADDLRLVFAARNGNQMDVHVHTVATGAEVVLPSLPLRSGELKIALAPDDSRVVVALPSASATNPNFPDTIFSASASGGDWTLLSSDAWPSFTISPDSRIVAATTAPDGVTESIFGGPPHRVGPIGEKLAFGVLFEPPGGLGKAIFYGPDATGTSFNSLIANADGTGDWLHLPPKVFCNGWAMHTAICWAYQDTYLNPPYDIIIVTDDGKQAGTVAQRVIAFDFAPTARKFYYLTTSGGLYAVDNPRP